MAVTPFGSGRIDKILDIIFTKQVTYAGASVFPEWDMIKRDLKKEEPLARSVRFRAVAELGYSASAAPRNPGAVYNFAKGRLSKVDEFEAQYKEQATTVSVPYSLYKQAQLAKDKKAIEPLILEMQNKAIAESRITAAQLWLDGTGVRATASSVDETSIAAGRVVVTLLDTDAARGHALCCELGDVLVLSQTSGTLRAASGAGAGSLYGYKVYDRDQTAQTVTFDLIDSDFNVLTNISATNLASGDVFYRVEQPTRPNLGSISDYGSASEIFPGIESWGAADGRSVFGMTMSGVYKGTQFDAGGDQLDAIHVERALGLGKTRMGEGRFSYKQMIMDDFSHSQLIDQRETDRRFNTYQDNVRGTTYWGYQHRKDNLRAVVSEYVRRRIWMLPTEVNKDRVLEYHGTNFDTVNVGGSSSFLNPSSTGSYSNEMVSFKRQIGTLFCRAPGAIVSVRNYGVTAP